MHIYIYYLNIFVCVPVCLVYIHIYICIYIYTYIYIYIYIYVYIYMYLNVYIYIYVYVYIYIYLLLILLIHTSNIPIINSDLFLWLVVLNATDTCFQTYEIIYKYTYLSKLEYYYYSERIVRRDEWYETFGFIPPSLYLTFFLHYILQLVVYQNNLHENHMSSLR